MPKKFKNIVRGNNRLEIRAAAEKEPASIYLTGAVGKSWFDDSGISAKEVNEALASIPKGSPIHAHINSEGGSVQEGLGIYNAFKKRSADITAFVDGYALSIASVFPLAASKVVSPKSAIWMMHKAWSWAQGNADDMTKQAEMLAEHDEMLAEIYAAETGRPIQEMRDAMADETWIRGSAAVDFGLADESDGEGEPQASYRQLPENYLSRCKNIGSEILNLFTGTPPATPGADKEPENNPADEGGATKPHNDTTMNKKTIVALLKKHGVDASESWTDEQFETALNKLGEKPAAALEGKTDNALEATVKAMAQQLASERKERISAKVDACIDEARITKDERDDAISRALADESYLKILAKRPAIRAGGEPIGSVSVGVENPMETIKALKTSKERVQAMKQDWKALHDDAVIRDTRRGALPMAANTYSSTLITSMLIDGAITNLQNRWAALGAFSMDFTADAFKPKATAVLRQVTAGAATQTNATSFESGDSTVAPVSVTMAQYTQSFQVSNADLQSGLRIENLVTINTANFANKITEVATVPMTSAIFTTPGVVSSAAAFSFSDLATLQALLKKSSIKNLILDGTYIARIANTPGFFQTTGVIGGDTGAWKAFGWDLIAQLTDWTGAGANVQGFACNPQAIAGVTGLPVVPPTIPGGILEQSSFIVPGLEVPVALYKWFNPSTRTFWTSFDIMAGFAAVDTTAGFLVTSA